MPLNPELVSASDLHDFASRLEARELLPRQVRRLIAATGDARVSIRAGEGIAVPGFDGIATIPSGSPALPAGPCVIEMGTVANPRAKAQDDYHKRTEQLDQPSDAAYVAITMRRWPARNGQDDKRTWADKRDTEGMWREVIALDADDLETWLQTCPSVHIWISEQMGRRPLEVRTLSDWWENWSQETVPPITPALMTAGRAKEVDSLRAWLHGSGPLLAVSGDSQEEACAFIASSLLLDTDEAEDVTTFLMVSTPEAWARLVSLRIPLLLLPRFPNADVSGAIRAGCRVLVPLSARESYHKEQLSLPRLGRSEAMQAFEAMGLPFGRSDEAALHVRRSFVSWRRSHSSNPSVARPPWAERPHGDLFGTLMLATCWECEHEGDKEAIARLCGKPYEEVERELLGSDRSPDPAFRRSGGVWTLAAPKDAWQLLHPLLVDADLRRWLEVAVDVVGEEDPTLSLPASERPFASVRGVRRKYSSHLRRGLAEGAALLGTGTNRIGREISAQLVRQLLQDANADDTGIRWRSLTDVLRYSQRPLLTSSWKPVNRR